MARLAWVSWGEERLAAVRRLRTIVPHPLAEMFSATVAIARGGLADAERDIDRGRANGPGDETPERYAVVGLDLVKGLLCLARGDETAGRQTLAREAARETSSHLFAREFAALARYALGASHLHAGQRDDARRAFGRALALAPRHAMVASVSPRAGRAFFP